MAIVPFAIWRPVPSHSGTMQAHQGLVLHVQVGNGSCYGEFDVPANQASSTWWVSKTGVLEQYVDSDLAAWTEAAGNFTWDSVETEGEPTESLTTAQVNVLARLYAWGVGAYGWPLAVTDDVNGRGFGWHGMGGAPWGNHPGCPGDLRKAQRQLIVNLAAQIVNPTPAPPAPSVTDPYMELIMSLATSPTDALDFVIRDKWATYRSDTLTTPAVQYLTAVYNQRGLDATLACIIDTATLQGHLRPMFAGAA